MDELDFLNQHDDNTWNLLKRRGLLKLIGVITGILVIE